MLLLVAVLGTAVGGSIGLGSVLPSKVVHSTTEGSCTCSKLVDALRIAASTGMPCKRVAVPPVLRSLSHLRDLSYGGHPLWPVYTPTLGSSVHPG